MKNPVIVVALLLLPACGHDTIVHPKQAAENASFQQENDQDGTVGIDRIRTRQTEAGAPSSSNGKASEDSLIVDNSLSENLPELPKSENSMGMEEAADSEENSEEALVPVLVNGAALTCQIGGPDTLFCLLDVPNLPMYTWTMRHPTGEAMTPDQFEVNQIQNEGPWNVRINMLESFSSLRAEASSIFTSTTGVVENHVHSSQLFNMETGLSIQDQLSRVYGSSYGDLTLTVGANNEVDGSWRNGNTTGTVTGTFYPETMEIRGRWVERAPGFPPYGGDVVFDFMLSPNGTLNADGEYSNDGANNSVPWPLNPKPL